MLKIAFVSTMGGVPWAGSEELWSDAAMKLSQAGLDVIAHCKWFPQIPPKLIQLQLAGCDIHRVRQPNRLQGWADKIARKRSIHRHAAWLDREEPSFVVISQSCQDGVGWGRLCLDRGIPFCMITQVVAEFYWPKDDLADEAADVMQRAERCFFVSQHNIELTSRQLGVELTNSELAWNPFAVSRNMNLGWPDQTTLRLACVGRLDPRHKGQDILFQALAEPQWRDRPIELALFGVGACEQSLRRLADLYQLPDVRFSGQVRHIETVWREHHALVLASRVEGMPLAAIEAMVCARPCVVTDVGGNAELVEHGFSGFVADKPSGPAFSRALEHLWARRSSLEEMGQNARQAIEDRLPPDPGAALAERLQQFLPVACV